MRILLDTPVFLWFISADPKLPPAYRRAVENAGNDVFLSVASVWEVVIKHRLGKLPLPAPPAEYLPRQREAHAIATLSIVEEAMVALSTLPPLHRDPFDRLIVAQAIHHGLTIAIVDPVVAAYVAPTLPMA